MKRTLLISSLIATASILAACGSMNDQQSTRGRNGPDGGHRSEMHQAAIAACENKTEGAAVTLTTPRGDTINAMCMKSPRNGQIHAMPNQMIEHMRLMEQACVGKKDGDTVNMTSPRNPSQSVTATCEMRYGKLMANMGKPPRDGMRPMQNAPQQ